MRSPTSRGDPTWLGCCHRVPAEPFPRTAVRPVPAPRHPPTHPKILLVLPVQGRGTPEPLLQQHSPRDGAKSCRRAGRRSQAHRGRSRAPPAPGVARASGDGGGLVLRKRILEKMLLWSGTPHLHGTAPGFPWAAVAGPPRVSGRAFCTGFSSRSAAGLRLPESINKDLFRIAALLGSRI